MRTNLLIETEFETNTDATLVFNSSVACCYRSGKKNSFFTIVHLAKTKTKIQLLLQAHQLFKVNFFMVSDIICLRTRLVQLISFIKNVFPFSQNSCAFVFYVCVAHENGKEKK